MKSIFTFVGAIVLSAAILNAQTVVVKEQSKHQIIKSVTVADINQRMMKSLSDHYPETVNGKVTWANTGFGYSATYFIDNVANLTQYNKSGDFLETFTKQAWDDRVPEIIKMEFGSSAYNTFTVIVFWEGTSDSNRHYYLEMMDKNSVSKNAWCDDNGKFSETPM